MKKNLDIEKLPPEIKKIMLEIQSREKKNTFIRYSASNEKSGESVAGNVSGCDDEVCGGGAGNVSACDDDVCQDPGGGEPGVAGNVSSCGDWVCDDDKAK